MPYTETCEAEFHFSIGVIEQESQFVEYIAFFHTVSMSNVLFQLDVNLWQITAIAVLA
jgi:hypothetical protein